MRISIAATAAVLSIAATLACAQAQQSQPQDHDAHHPKDATQGSPTTPTSPQAPTQAPMGPGGGTMSQGGMMGGGSMMGMMRNGMPMMGMMQMMGSSGTGMGGMATIDRVEGRIEFLKTELKITDEQSGAWNAFAETLRANSKQLGELRASMTGDAAPKTLADRLQWQEKWLTARAEGTKAIRTAYGALDAKLTETQKTTATQILAPHMGMMTMMSGMGPMGPGQMGMGNSGQPPAQKQGDQMMRQKMMPKN